MTECVCIGVFGAGAAFTHHRFKDVMTTDSRIKARIEEMRSKGDK